MPPDPSESTRLLNIYRKKRKIRIRMFVFAIAFLLIVGFVVMPVMDGLGISRWLWAPFVYLILFGYIIFLAILWRCPVCGSRMGDVFTARYCPGCGMDFRPDENDQFKNNTL